MNKHILHLSLMGICLTSHMLFSAAGSGSPTGTSWTDYFTGLAHAGYGKLQKLTGTKPIDYCIDKEAQALLKQTEQLLELALADNRAEGKTKTYLQLMSNPIFQDRIKRLNDRAYFEWEHIKNAIAGDRFQDVVKFWKNNRINLSPCLRIAIRLYLEQNHLRRKAALNPKANMIRFDLNQLELKPGYVEATIPKIKEEQKAFPELTQTIREYASNLGIASPIQSAERRFRKSTARIIDPSFSLKYLTSAPEIEKAMRLYPVLFSYLFRASRLNIPLTELFSTEEFLNVYNQAWDRDMHLRDTLTNQLSCGSLDACSIYINHKENIPPLFATLICDMILSHEQKDASEHVSPTFKEIFFHEKKPYGKYVFIFLNNLNKKQKTALLTSRKEIESCASSDAQLKAIFNAIGKDQNQMELLAEIQRGDHFKQLLFAIEQARVSDIPSMLPSGLIESSPIHIPSIIVSTSSSSSSSSATYLTSARQDFPHPPSDDEDGDE